MERKADYNGYPSSEHYCGVKDFGKIVCIDIDGCILHFDGYKGNDVYGSVIEGARDSIHHLAINGWYIVLFTTRLVTSELMKVLRLNEIPFDDINGRKGLDGTIRLQTYIDRLSVDYEPTTETHFWKHNPSHASIKPIASVYIDDMSWENEGKNYTKEKWQEVIKSLDRRFGTTTS